MGTISANGDSEIGRFLAEAMKKVGNEGVITVGEAKSLETELDVVDAMHAMHDAVAALNSTSSRCIEDPKRALGFFGHCRYENAPPHERYPGLFCDRLQLRKIPKLSLGHRDLSHLVVEHPGTQGA